MSTINISDVTKSIIRSSADIFVFAQTGTFTNNILNSTNITVLEATGPITIYSSYTGTTIVNNNYAASPTGPQGPLGPAGSNGIGGATGSQGFQGPPGSGGGSTLSNGLKYSDYLFWNSNSPSGWAVGSDTIHLGNNAGLTTQQNFAIALGTSAGVTVQGTGSIAIGNNAGSNRQGSNSISIGSNAGFSSQGLQSIAIGINAGYITQSSNAVSIGSSAGYDRQSTGTVAIGWNAGLTTQRANSVAIGTSAGEYDLGSNSVAIGNYAGNYSLGRNCIGIGPGAFANWNGVSQGSNSIALGTSAAYTNGMDSNSIAIGTEAMKTILNFWATNCIAIGTSAAGYRPRHNSIAIGNQAGYNNNDEYSVGIGYQAGYTSQGTRSVAIGTQAGYNFLDEYSIAIGNLAGYNVAAARSIILNASDTALDANNNGLFINPVRSTNTTTNGLVYNTTTKEIMYNSAKTFVIDHPLDESKYLVHACLEGPEAGVYYRGESRVTAGQKSVVVQLPSYVDAFVTQFTVQLTLIADDSNVDENIVLRTSKVSNNQFTVYSNSDSGCEFYWTVFGLRKEIVVEPSKAEVELKGDGPYRWI